MRDYNIDVLTMADVTKLEGEPGHFKVEVRKRPRGVNRREVYRLRRLLVRPARSAIRRRLRRRFAPSEPLAGGRGRPGQ